MKGFTVIELMIVVAILAILLAVAMGGSNGNYVAQNIGYIKDDRTGICYAVDNSYRKYGHGNGVIGPVDCDKVRNQLQ